jgi:hypothetical protein
MNWLIMSAIALPLMAFWLWMFWEMSVNDQLPSYSPKPFSLPPTSKFTWTLLFVVFNIFGAIYYCFTAYRKSR